MHILEISAEDLDYVARLCLDPFMPPTWREAMQTAMDARKKWLKAMMRQGLRVLVALEESGDVLRSFSARNRKIRELVIRGRVPKGLIEYVPIEFAPEPVRGEKTLFVNCIWVLSKFWHGGVAKGLMERFIEDAKAYGGASVLAYEGDKWFGFFPYMPVSFFEKFGFKEVDRDGSRVLLHLNLGDGEQPKLIEAKTREVRGSGKLVVDVLFSSQCPWSEWMADKVKRGMKKYGAVVNAISTDDRRVIEEYGLSRGVCINGRPLIKRMASWKEIDSAVKQVIGH
jgi:N-acetylglutamate synthase-like GNAT family acetyltransferase